MDFERGAQQRPLVNSDRHSASSLVRRLTVGAVLRQDFLCIFDEDAMLLSQCLGIIILGGRLGVFRLCHDVLLGIPARYERSAAQKPITLCRCPHIA